jgi:hypothetical protein
MCKRKQLPLIRDFIHQLFKTFLFQDVKYKVEDVDIKGKPAGTCSSGDKLTIDNTKAKKVVCGKANVTETAVDTGKLKVQFKSNDDSETGSGFKLTLAASYKGTYPKSMLSP